ncbi:MULTISPECIES: hypothetical protein [Lactobacillus]|uniref:hypothetical protein n=1 Tax=Lactobacillus TaxID=1578 RepID=UPI0011DD88CB|nr:MULTISPECIES: hypothetical protein [Lactobacillus]MCR1903378.1 hypothetical protein [Lactobacillus taiwanensis]
MKRRQKVKKYSFKEIFTEPEILSQIILEVTYIIIIISYLIHLDNFNKLMFAKGFTSKLEESNSIFVASKILKEGGSSYFFGAVIWVAVGGFLFYIFYKIGQTSYYPVVGIIIKVLHVVVLLLFIVVLCHLINNPIVRALIIMFGFGSLLGTILSNS